MQKEFNPNIIEGLNRLSSLASEEEQFINKIVENEYEKVLISGDNEEKVIFDLKKFNQLDNVIKSRLIIYTIGKVYGKVNGIEKIHIDDIIKLCNNNIGNKYLTPKKGIKIYVHKGKIFFLS